MPPLVTKPLGMIDVTVFPGLSYNKESDTFFNSLRNNKVEAQVEFTLKVMERTGLTSY